MVPKILHETNKFNYACGNKEIMVACGIHARISYFWHLKKLGQHPNSPNKTNMKRGRKKTGGAWGERKLGKLKRECHERKVRAETEKHNHKRNMLIIIKIWRRSLWACFTEKPIVTHLHLLPHPYPFSAFSSSSFSSLQPSYLR